MKCNKATDCAASSHFGDCASMASAPIHTQAQVDDLLATVRREEREAVFKIWHGADEEMPAHEEIIAIHKKITFSIGYKRDLEIINFIDAWCTRRDLVKWALEASATEKGEMNG